MLTKEPLVSPDSEYFLFMPSAVASQVYLYPVCIGHFRYQAGYSLSRNQYDSFLIMAVLSGRCELQTGAPASGSPFVTAVRDQVILLDCYAPHAYRFPEDSEILWLHFDGALARPYYDILTQGAGPVYTIKDLYPVTHNLRRILEGFQQGQVPKESAISARITQILGALMEDGQQKDGTAMRPNTRPRNDPGHLANPPHRCRLRYPWTRPRKSGAQKSQTPGRLPQRSLAAMSRMMQTELPKPKRRRAS